MKKLKVIIFVFLLAAIASACSGENSSAQENDLYYFEEPGYLDQWSKEPFGLYNGDAIPTKECAVSVACAIHDAIPNNRVRIPIAVSFDETANAWIVHFAREPIDEETYIIGDEISIALRKGDGRVLRIWFQE